MLDALDPMSIAAFSLLLLALGALFLFNKGRVGLHRPIQGSRSEHAGSPIKSLVRLLPCRPGLHA